MALKYPQYTGYAETPFLYRLDILKACPHCGANPPSTTEAVGFFIGEKRTEAVILVFECLVGQWNARVVCNGCGTSSGMYLTNNPREENMEELLCVKNWNQRV